MEQITFEQLPMAVARLIEKLNTIEVLLQEKANVTVTSAVTDTDQLLTIRQAAEILSLSVPTIYGLVQRASIPVSKRGKRLYFTKLELIDWIKAGRKSTIAEIESKAEIFLNNRRK